MRELFAPLLPDRDFFCTIVAAFLAGEFLRKIGAWMQNSYWIVVVDMTLSSTWRHLWYVTTAHLKSLTLNY